MGYKSHLTPKGCADTLKVFCAKLAAAGVVEADIATWLRVQQMAVDVHRAERRAKNEARYAEVMRGIERDALMRRARLS
jgi:hypothetical protein